MLKQIRLQRRLCGAISLPQVAAAVIGALAGWSATRLARPLLRISLALNALGLLLAGTVALSPQAALVVVLLGTASLGLGFGLSGAPINGLPSLYFPRHRETAIVAMHTLLGLGLALGPVIANVFILRERWVGFPLTLTIVMLVACVATWLMRAPHAERGADNQPATAPAPAADPHPARATAFWLFAGVAMLYAFAEGTFSNWAVLYLQDTKQLPESVASTALSAFWATSVTGRLLSSLLVLRIPRRASGSRFQRS